MERATGEILAALRREMDAVATVKPAKAKRIVLAALGSLGDLHPTLALALELKRRGHRVTVASTAYYRDKVEALGIGFAPLRPDWDPTDRDLIAQCEDLKSGPEVLISQADFAASARDLRGSARCGEGH